jgi:hypothetical protein
VAVGVGIGILLGAYRIVQGDSLVYYILSGYVVVIIMTFFAPRTIIPIAYDSGGVTTSTITVPIVAALGLGLATSIPGRDPLIDGFGLIAFASLFPMITVLGYGISKRETIRFHERRILRMEQEVFSKVSQHVGARLDDADLDGDGVGDTAYINSLPLPKRSIVTITGDSGSGVSTVTALLAEALDYRKFNAGGLFRNLAQQYDMTLEKLESFIESNRASIGRSTRSSAPGPGQRTGAGRAPGLLLDSRELLRLPQGEPGNLRQARLRGHRFRSQDGRAGRERPRGGPEHRAALRIDEGALPARLRHRHQQHAPLRPRDRYGRQDPRGSRRQDSRGL